MFIRNQFTPRDVCSGQTFSEPSLTVPDLSYSVKQLIADGAVGQLPPLSRLRWDDIDENTDNDLDENLEFDTYSDIRFSDRADAYEQMNASSSVINSIKLKVKAMRDFKRRQESMYNHSDVIDSHSESEKPITASE